MSKYCRRGQGSERRRRPEEGLKGGGGQARVVHTNQEVGHARLINKNNTKNKRVLRVPQNPRNTPHTPKPTPPRTQTWSVRAFDASKNVRPLVARLIKTATGKRYYHKSTPSHAHTHASRLYPPTTHTASNHACPTTRMRGAGRRPFGCLECSSLHPAHARRLAPAAAAAAAMRVVNVLHRIGKRPDHVSRSKRKEGRERAGGWMVWVAMIYCFCASCFV